MTIFVSRPISATFIVIGVLLLAAQVWIGMRAAVRRRSAAADLLPQQPLLLNEMPEVE
jgi:hypothetical protein